MAPGGGVGLFLPCSAWASVSVGRPSPSGGLGGVSGWGLVRQVRGWGPTLPLGVSRPAVRRSPARLYGHGRDLVGVDFVGFEPGCLVWLRAAGPTGVGKPFFSEGCVLLGFTGWVFVGGPLLFAGSISFGVLLLFDGGGC